MLSCLRSILGVSFTAWKNKHLEKNTDLGHHSVTIAGLLTVMFALYWLCQFFLTRTPQLDASVIRRSAIILTTIGTLILIKFAVEGAIQLFYEVEETAFLFSTPTPATAIFAANFIILIGRNSLNMLAWLVPPWIAFGVFFHLSWPFYLTITPICFFYLVIVISQTVLGILLLMSIPPISQNKRIRKYFSFWQRRGLKILTGLIGVLMAVIIAFSLIAISENEVLSDNTIIDQSQQRLLSWSSSQSWRWSPHQWMTQLMIASAADLLQPELQLSFQPLLIQLTGTALLLPILLTALAGLIYRSSWELQQVAPTYRSSTGQTEPKSKSGWQQFVWKSHFSPLIYKDLLVFTGRKGRWLTVLFFSLIQLVMVYSVVSSTRQADETNYIIFGILSQINLYGVILTFGLTFFGFQAENETWWLLQSSPLTAGKAYASKFMAAVLFAMAYITPWTLLLLVTTGWALTDWIPIVLISLLSVTAAIALNTSVGCFPWVHGIRLNRSTNSILGLFTIIVATMISGVLLIVPFLIWQMVVIEEISVWIFNGWWLKVTVIGSLGTGTVLITVLSVLVGQRYLGRFL